MTLDSFASRLAAALGFSGLGVWVAAVVCWATAGHAGSAVHSIHTVAGSGLAVLGSVLIVIGLTISSGVSPKTRPESPGIEVSDGAS